MERGELFRCEGPQLEQSAASIHCHLHNVPSPLRSGVDAASPCWQVFHPGERGNDTLSLCPSLDLLRDFVCTRHWRRGERLECRSRTVPRCCRHFFCSRREGDTFSIYSSLIRTRPRRTDEITKSVGKIYFQFQRGTFAWRILLNEVKNPSCFCFRFKMHPRK